MGAARAHRGRRGRAPGRRARDFPSAAHARPGGFLGGGALYRHRIPAGVLSALPRLRQVLPAVGAGALSQPATGEFFGRGPVRDVSSAARLAEAAGCGRNAIVSANSPRTPLGGPSAPPGTLRNLLCCFRVTSMAARNRAVYPSTFGRVWAALDPERLPKAAFPVLPKLRELVPYLSAGALLGDEDRDRVLRAAPDVSAIRHFRSVIAVTGLAFEARIAGGVTVISDGLRTGATLKAEIERGSRGVISFGIAGGLAPHLPPGQWVVASAIVSDRARLTTAPGRSSSTWNPIWLRGSRPPTACRSRRVGSSSIRRTATFPQPHC